MKKDIILSGVGGQGILSIAAVIGMAALKQNLKVKQAEVHGMSQRGGAVQSHLRLSDQEIASDLIPHGQADLILSVEPMESLRYLPYLANNGWLVSNITSFQNIPDYPPVEEVLNEIISLPNRILIDADKIAKDCGSVKASNMVVLGAGSALTGMESSFFISSIQKIFKSKGEDVIKMNIRAFEEGYIFAVNYL